MAGYKIATLSNVKVGQTVYQRLWNGEVDEYTVTDMNDHEVTAKTEQGKVNNFYLVHNQFPHLYVRAK